MTTRDGDRDSRPGDTRTGRSLGWPDDLQSTHTSPLTGEAIAGGLAEIVSQALDAPVALVGIPDGTADALDWTGYARLSDGHGIQEEVLSALYQRVVTADQLLAIPDIHQEPHLAQIALETKTVPVAFLMAPVRNTQYTTAGLCLVADIRSREWTDSERMMLASWAESAAAAVGLEAARNAAQAAANVAEQAHQQKTAILERITEAFIALDRDWRLTYCNQAAGQVLDRPAADVIGKNLWHEFPILRDTLLFTECHRAAEQQSSATFEMACPWSGRWISVHAYPSSEGVSLYMQDITERKEAEDAFQRWAMAIASSMDGIAILDSEHRYTYVNDAHAKVYGYDRAEELLGQRWHILYDEAEARRIDEVVMPIVRAEGRWRGEAIGRRRDGTTFPQELSLTGLDRDELICVVRDITNRKEAEQNMLRLIHEQAAHAQAEAARRQITDILDSITDAFIAVDRRGRITYVNPRAEHLLGQNRSELLLQNVREVFPEIIDLGFFKQVREAISVNQSIEFEEYYPSRNAWYEVHIYPTPDGLSVYFHDITTRKEADIRLREAEAKYRTLVEQIPVITYTQTVDVPAVTTYVSPQIEAILGYPVEAWLADPSRWQTVLHPDDRDAVLRAAAHADDTGEPFCAEYRLLAHDGRVVWVRDEAALVSDTSGQPRFWQGIMLDITEQRRVQEELHRRSQEFKALVENAPDAIVRFDRALQLVYANPAAEQVLDLPIATLLGKSAIDLWRAAEFSANWQETLEQVLTTGHESLIEIASPARDGPHYYQARLSPEFAADGTPEHVLAVIRDITARKRIEVTQRFLAGASAVLSASLDYETTLASVVRLAVPRLAEWCVVLMVDEAGEIDTIKIATADSAKEPLLSDVINQYPPSPESRSPVAAALYHGRSGLRAEISDADLEAIATDDEHLRLLRELDAQSSITVPLVARGRTLGVLAFWAADPGRYTAHDLGLAEDLARRAALAVDNARLYREAQQAIQAREEFLSVAAHELKTPVTSLRGFAQLTLRQLDKHNTLDPDRMRRALTAIDQQSVKLTRLVAQLLDVSRVESGHLVLERAVTDITGLVETVATLAQASTTRHSINVHAPGPVLAWVDPLRLEQVVTNLVDNAIKYSPDGGPIELVVSSPTVDTVRLSVSDHGVGLSPADQDHIFERFYQGHGGGSFGGLGIGLYISRQIVNLHGGRLDVEIPDHPGTTFAVTLPTHLTAEGTTGQ